MRWVRDNFGSKKGMIREVSFRIGWPLHPLARATAQTSGVERLVFVCKGNVCRSALAESVAGRLGFPACSFGLNTTPGKSADDRMRNAATELGFDLSAHLTASFRDYEPCNGDMVLLFEPSHLKDVDSMMPNLDLVALLGAWAKPPKPYIHDPYGASPAYYLKSARLIQQSVANLVQTVRGDHAS
jgi:protein-tyrosine phosphatase